VNRSEVRREKHIIGWKCNVDTTFHESINLTSAGCCVPNEVGEFFMANLPVYLSNDFFCFKEKLRHL